MWSISGTQSWVQVTCLNFGKLLCTKNHADRAAKNHASHIIHITSNHLHEFLKLKLHGFLCRATCQNSGKSLWLNFETPYYHIALYSSPSDMRFELRRKNTRLTRHKKNTNSNFQTVVACVINLRG